MAHTLQSENGFKIIKALSPEVRDLLSLDESLPDESEGSDCEVEPKKFIRRGEWVGLGQEDEFCGKRFSELTCKREMHDYGVAIFCGREWHSVCGADGSWMHYRRVARMAWRIFWLGSQSKAFGLGYWVFTIPMQIRDKFRKQSALRRADKFLIRLLKQYGFKESVSRWHWFGSGEIREDEELELGEYHPHLNVLVTGKWMRDDELNAIREAWRRYLEVMSGESIDAVDIHYQYVKEQSKWMHKAKYICRATFKRLQGNEDLAVALYHFKNTHYTGFGRGTKYELKKAHGQALYEIWKSDTKDSIGEEIKEHDKSVGDYQEICSECAKEGIYSRLHAKQTFEGFRKVLSAEEILPRIEREIRFGFYLLKDIILKDKPATESVDTTDREKESYDST